MAAAPLRKHQVMEKNKIRLLSTARLPRALVGDAASEDIDITVLPFIETEAIGSTEIQQEIDNAFLLSSIVVFTSQNAVKIVAETKEEQQPDWLIYCVGEKTTELATTVFGENMIAGTANNAASLAEIILEEQEPDEIIFFSGTSRMDDLPEILEKNGVLVNEINVYHTVAVPHRVENDFDGLLFFSPSAVDSFFRHNEVNSSQTIFSTGPTTTASLEKKGNFKIITCRKTGKAEMIGEVMKFYNR
jgi:uroporphyrinogen-III synthase